MTAVGACPGSVAEVDAQAELRLPEQAQVGVVDQHVHVRDAVLCADGQLLDHEREVVVARQRDHLRVRFGRRAAKRGRHPASRAAPPARS
jgi:hypothetical protein